jgi:hypothetical protein
LRTAISDHLLKSGLLRTPAVLAERAFRWGWVVEHRTIRALGSFSEVGLVMGCLDRQQVRGLSPWWWDLRGKGIEIWAFKAIHVGLSPLVALGSKHRLLKSLIEISRGLLLKRLQKRVALRHIHEVILGLWGGNRPYPLRHLRRLLFLSRFKPLLLCLLFVHVQDMLLSQAALQIGLRPYLVKRRCWLSTLIFMPDLDHDPVLVLCFNWFLGQVDRLFLHLWRYIWVKIKSLPATFWVLDLSSSLLAWFLLL